MFDFEGIQTSYLNISKPEDGCCMLLCILCKTTGTGQAPFSECGLICDFQLYSSAMRSDIADQYADGFYIVIEILGYYTTYESYLFVMILVIVQELFHSHQTELCFADVLCLVYL